MYLFDTSLPVLRVCEKDEVGDEMFLCESTSVLVQKEGGTREKGLRRGTGTFQGQILASKVSNQRKALFIVPPPIKWVESISNGGTSEVGGD